MNCSLREKDSYSVPFWTCSREDLSNDMTDHWFIFKKNAKFVFWTFKRSWELTFMDGVLFSPIFGKFLWSLLQWYGWPLVYLKTLESKKLLIRFRSKRSCDLILVVWLMFIPFLENRKTIWPPGVMRSGCLALKLQQPIISGARSSY